MLINPPFHKWIVYFCYIIVGSAITRLSGGDIVNQFIGCYQESRSQFNWTTALSDSSNLSIEQCIEKCKRLNRTFAILQNGRNCQCGDNFDASLSKESCTTPCSGNPTQYCGGSDVELQYYTFYAVCPIGYYGTDCNRTCHCKRRMPCHLATGVCPNGCDGNWAKTDCSEERTFAGRYIGCYRDKSIRDLSALEVKVNDSNPIRWCSNLCAKKGYTYSGLQYRQHCFCGENYGVHGELEDSSCNLRCSSHQNQTCGGVWANSVYSVCETGRFGSDCLGTCNCKDREVCNVRNGTCKSGCQPGWMGPECHLRDCSMANGDCLENEACVVLNFTYASLSASRCMCASGYGRNSLWDKCRDLNECAMTPSVCDSTTETCHNTIGSYICISREGFHRNSMPGKCKAIAKDETTGNDAATVVCFVVGLILIGAIIILLLLYLCRLSNCRTSSRQRPDLFRLILTD